MDALLGLIVALLVFVAVIFLIHRSVKTILFLGAIILVFMLLSSLGVWK